MFAALVTAVVLPVADLSDAAKKELKALEGEWVAVATASNGSERELPERERLRVTFTGAKFALDKLGTGEITALDPSTDPKIVDFVMKREPASGYVNEGIYKVEKGTLTLVVYLGEGKKRPTGFGIPEGTDTWRLTFERPK